MWKHRIALALATAIALSIALLVPTASALKKPRTFSLLEEDRTEAPLGDFTFDRAPVAGDQFTETNAGAHVGRDRVLLTFVTGFGPNFTHRATLLATAQLYLPDGTLLVEAYGTIPPDGPHFFKLPVIGGTGVYENAPGYMTTRGLGNGMRPHTKLDLHLVP
jgi:hypothetical protein